MSNGRRPVSALSTLHLGDIQHESEFIKKRLRDQDPDQSPGSTLGVARVVDVDYEEHFVTLRTLIGTSQEFERVQIPITYPGAGARHFLGAMPEIGDCCVVGWFPQDTSTGSGTKTPVILSWIIPGVWPGRDWLTTANFTEDEHDQGSSRNREEVRGNFERTRHKLPHIHPGNVVATSSQGSDLVLDENVSLTNRRGNEFILRDADQAAVLRALQQFTALAGSRTYAGMVQRDALRLPTTMFSDGKRWDGVYQAEGGLPVHESDLLDHSSAPKGLLTPAAPFQRVLGAGGKAVGNLERPPAYLDPYSFLRLGGYIDEQGMAVDEKHVNDAVYGGKSIYRVMAGSKENGVLQPEASILTEHRIEVSHTSDGRLPVTEQTDGFDAERLPPTDPDSAGVSPNSPFIEWVLGSVVGNDPFSGPGRKQYGVPLVTQVFDALGGLGPRIESARVAAPGQEGGTPLGEHAATLFKLTPISGQLAPTWWSVNKKGQVRASISGPPKEHSLDVALAGGMRLASGGGLELLLKGGIHFGTLSKNSLRLRSEEGPVVIYGGGSAKDGEDLLEREQGTNGGDGDLPSVDIRAKQSARLWAEKSVQIKGQKIEASAASIKILGQNEVEISASKQISVSTEDMKTLVNGKRTDTYIGPKNLLPTNGALHERSYNPMYPGLVCEDVTYLWGDRKETFLLGNHTTDILIGNMTYKTVVGTWKAQAGLNSLEVDTVGGVKGQVVVGDVTLTAVAGSATMRGLVSAVVQSAGPTTIRSGTVLTLGAPISGPDFGPIICAGSLEPFTNLPFITWGLGAKNHLVGV